jgi:hypothetical protein
VPVVKVGDWMLARRILASAAPRFQRVVRQAVLQEAQLLRGEIVSGLTSQAPGGTAFLPLATSTIAKRRLLRFGGTKALIVRSDLRRSVTVQELPGFGGAFVGVNRTARGSGGQLLANVAELNEFGSRPIAIRITPRMRRFLMALRAANGGGGSGGGSGGGGGGPGVVIVQIPARPFIRPAVEKLFGSEHVVASRFLGRIARALGYDFGTP